MYYYGGSGCGCGNSGMNYQSSPCYYPTCNYSNNNGNSSTYAIILVLFILLVIVIGTRFIA